MLKELEIKLNAWMGKGKFASHFKIREEKYIYSSIFELIIIDTLCPGYCSYHKYLLTNYHDINCVAISQIGCKFRKFDISCFMIIQEQQNFSAIPDTSVKWCSYSESFICLRALSPWNFIYFTKEDQLKWPEWQMIFKV